LLLAILKLIEEGHIIGNMIKFDEQLIITYTRIFKNYSEKVTPIEYPYYYMRNDCFYSIKGKAEKKTPSVNYIKQNIEYAYLDDDLWDIIQDKSTRDWLKHEIIEYYLK
jgi:putative restriction endonuclease